MYNARIIRDAACGHAIKKLAESVVANRVYYSPCLLEYHGQNCADAILGDKYIPELPIKLDLFTAEEAAAHGIDVKKLIEDISARIQNEPINLRLIPKAEIDEYTMVVIEYITPGCFEAIVADRHTPIPREK